MNCHEADEAGQCAPAHLPPTCRKWFSFAHPSQVLLEIQSTLADSPKKSQHPMKKAVFTGITTAVSLYMGVAIAGYLALGNDVPPEILTGFNGPEWVVVLANIAVLVHMFGAYQVRADQVGGAARWTGQVRVGPDRWKLFVQ